MGAEATCLDLDYEPKAIKLSLTAFPDSPYSDRINDENEEPSVHDLGLIIGVSFAGALIFTAIVSCLVYRMCYHNAPDATRPANNEDLARKIDPGMSTIEMSMINGREVRIRPLYHKGSLRVTLGPLIGEGAQSVVYHGKLNVGGSGSEHVAVKVYSSTARILRELYALKDLRHSEYLVKYIGHGSLNQQFCLCLEFCALGNLRKLMNGQILPCNGDVVFKILTNITSGMIEMHGKGWLHRDIKAENILIKQSKKVKGAGLDDRLASFRHIVGKIADLGISKPSELCGATSGPFHGTLLYMAPECLVETGTENGIDNADSP